MPIDLYPEDYHESLALLEGVRQFELVNEGDGPIAIDHMGVDSKYYSCGHKGIQIVGLTCVEDPQHYQGPQQLMRKTHEEKFILAPLSRYNLTVRFYLQLRNWPQGKRSLEMAPGA
jgi:hypothetical protein